MSTDWPGSKTDTCSDSRSCSVDRDPCPFLLPFPAAFVDESFLESAPSTPSLSFPSEQPQPLCSDTQCELCARPLLRGSTGRQRIRLGPRGQILCEACFKRQQRRAHAEQQLQNNGKKQRRRELRDCLLQEISRALEYLHSSELELDEVRVGLEHVDSLFDRLVKAEQRLDLVS